MNRLNHLFLVLALAGAFSQSDLLLAQSPVVNGISPSTGPTSGGTTITLTGSNFGTDGTVNFDGVTATNVSWSQNLILFKLPGGQGVNVPVSVTTGGQTSGTIDFSYAAPAISGVSPSSGPTVGGTVITIFGKNFGTNGVVTIGGALMTSNSWSNTQIIGRLPTGQGLKQQVIVTVSGQASTPVDFNYNAPAITSISPGTGPTAGGTTITLEGNNFGSGGTINFAGTTVSSTSWSQTNVQFKLPSGQGANLAVSVTVSGQTSGTARFSYDAPSISSVSPSSGPTAGGILITLVGENFGTSGTATIGGAAISTSSWFDTNIIGTLPMGQGLKQQVIVAVSGQASAPADFNYDAPAISSISPSSGSTAGGTTITLKGDNFGSSGTINFAGTTVPSTSWSQTNVQFTLPLGQGTDLPVSVTVSGQTSGTARFSYDAPSISSVSPSSGPTAGGILITLVGENFGTSGTATIGGAAISTSSWSDTNIIGTLPSGMGLNQQVIVTVSGQVSAPTYFNYNAPAIASISPSTGPAAGGTIITLKGENFGSSGTINFAGTTVPSTLWSQTNVEFTLPSGQGANLAVNVSVSGQTSGTARFSYDAPGITNISPSTGPTVGRIAITLTGSNFGTNGTVTIGGALMTSNSWSNTQIIGTLPAGQGLNQPVIVTVSGQASAPAYFNYDAPAISSISPSAGPTAGGTIITIAGRNFGTSGTVTIGGNSASTAFWGQTEILCLTPPGTGESLPVTVVCAGQSSNAGLFSYVRPTLTIRSGSDVIVLTWPTNATDYVLEQAGDLTNNPWSAINPALTTNGQNLNATLPLDSTNEFFRLRRQ